MNEVYYYDECYFLDYNTYADINIYEVGVHKYPPRHTFGPMVRKYHVLHFVFYGRGVFSIGGRKYSAKMGEAFVTPPNVVTSFHSDADNPWQYIWVHFDGSKIIEYLHEAGISAKRPVFMPLTQNDDALNCLFDILHHYDKELYCIGKMYLFFELLISNSKNRIEMAGADPNQEYTREIIRFISNRYRDPIRIHDIADFCGLERSYISKMFRAETGMSLQEYLISYRMKMAKILLKQDLSIQQIAHSVGYSDPFSFSKAFKKQTNVSPSAYRQALQNR